MRCIGYIPALFLQKKSFVHPCTPRGVTLMSVIVSARLANPAAPARCWAVGRGGKQEGGGRRIALMEI